jgi:hypothetical protein
MGVSAPNPSMIELFCGPPIERDTFRTRFSFTLVDHRDLALAVVSCPELDPHLLRFRFLFEVVLLIFL